MSLQIHVHSQSCPPYVKQSHVLKGHLFLVLSGNFIWIEPHLTGHLSYKATFSLLQRWPLITGLTLYTLEISITTCIFNKFLLKIPIILTQLMKICLSISSIWLTSTPNVFPVALWNIYEKNIYEWYYM